MKRLIVNADDFGMTSGVNRAIIEAHAGGIVTSTTLMASGSAFDEAVRFSRDNPGLAVGAHITLVQATPLSAAKDIPSIAFFNNGQTLSRYRGFSDLAWAAFRGRINPEEVEREAIAQFRRIQAEGVRVSHFDTHKHAHLLPELLRPLLQAARECGIRAVRCPFEPGGNIPVPELLVRPRLCKRRPIVGLLRRYRPEFLRLAGEYGIATADGAIGISATGCLDESLLEAMLERLPEGTWELVCHPAYVDSQLRSLSTLRTGESEREALMSSRIRRCLQIGAIQLISYRQLIGSTLVP